MRSKAPMRCRDKRGLPNVMNVKGEYIADLFFAIHDVAGARSAAFLAWPAALFGRVANGRMRTRLGGQRCRECSRDGTRTNSSPMAAIPCLQVLPRSALSSRLHRRKKDAEEFTVTRAGVSRSTL